ncbi:MAG: nucleotidyltransferase substrate binding protein [Muribaculaceae bacterium]|nr:nucleotidyltransferase substrate binding protein [Muribaculaceae bacterium]
MKEGTFDISALASAKQRLSEVILRYEDNKNDDVVRDSVIQRFEFTYSITLKTLRKYFIERAFAVDEINEMSFNDLIRTANQLGLLKSNLELWTEFRNMRNITSHTYDEKIAMKIVNIIPDFYQEVAFLLEQLRKKLNV